jgi:hypothetical protein
LHSHFHAADFGRWAVDLGVFRLLQFNFVFRYASRLRRRQTCQL